MVCLRCKMAVEMIMDVAEITYQSIELGRVKLQTPLSPEQKKTLNEGLRHFGLELMENRAKILVERIKTEIIALLQAPHTVQLKLSVHRSQALDYNYTYLANTFSEQEGTTLERYFIGQRVERVKELLVYEDWSLTKIADELEYSSVSHLCLQFKKMTGLKPAEFKKFCQSEDYVWRSL